MDAGVVVVLAVLGVFLLVPLVFAWVSTDSRRWGRVEAVLGREPRGSERWARWARGIRVGIGSVYLVLGIVQLRGDQSLIGWVLVVIGILQVALGVTAYLLRGRVQSERSVQPHVQDRAEPRRPGSGG
jgi:hypothetical protein